MSVASWCCTCKCFCVVLCVSSCTGHFVMVPLNLTYIHCLQHSLFEHLFNLYCDRFLVFIVRIKRCPKWHTTLLFISGTFSILAILNTVTPIKTTMVPSQSGLNIEVVWLLRFVFQLVRIFMSLLEFDTNWYALCVFKYITCFICISFHQWRCACAELWR